MVFKTLNEARRLEPRRKVNGALWDLTVAGYASLMTLGIRKLVDKDQKTDSIWTLIAKIENRPELLTHENFVCFDGLRYDFQTAYQEFLASKSLSAAGKVSSTSVPVTGPNAWAMSQMLHSAFDKVSGKNPNNRKRGDTVLPELLQSAKEMLAHPSIDKVHTLVDQQIAHAQRRSNASEAIATATYDDIDLSLKQLIRVTNFVAGSIFYEAPFGGVVSIPQYDVLRALDKPWLAKKNLLKLHDFWAEQTDLIDSWAHDQAKATKGGT